MIRDSKRVRASIVLTMIIAITVLTAAVVQAGDSDGVLGYSMKLKNREITPGGTGGSADGLVVGPIPSAKPTSREPMLTAPNRLFVIIPVGFYSYLPSWSLMFLQPR